MAQKAGKRQGLRSNCRKNGIRTGVWGEKISKKPWDIRLEPASLTLDPNMSRLIMLDPEESF